MSVGASELIRDVNGVAVPIVGTWRFDPGHSEVGCQVRHISTQIRGRFLRFDGRLVVAELPEDSFAEIDIDTKSLATGNDDRDAQLFSEDWLDVENYPKITYRSTHLRHGQGNVWVAAGQLTVRDITRDLELQIHFNGADVDTWGNRKLGFDAAGVIDREGFGMRWNAPLGSGRLLVGSEVAICANIEANLRTADSTPVP